MSISFRKPVITRGGNKVRFYHVYPNYIHGAYETKEDHWIIARWEINGYFYPLNEQGRQPITSLDLINEEPTQPENYHTRHVA